MPRRHNEQNSDEPVRKKSFTMPEHDRIDIGIGEILTDITGKQWKLGKIIGLGGFGVIHEISEVNAGGSDKYVVKIEAHTSGPLFTEINCYLRIGRKESIEDWKSRKGLPSLGMANYVASGSHIFEGNKYRFLILPRYKTDLELLLQEKKKFNLKTVLLISSQILHILEYIHSNGYIHSDVKAANIMLSQVKVTQKESSSKETSTYSKSPMLNSRRYPRLRTCKARKLSEVKQSPVSKRTRYGNRRIKNVNYNEDFLSEFSSYVVQGKEENCTSVSHIKDKLKDTKGTLMDQLFLLDFGLASKYKLSNGEHKKIEDERKAHAGTLLFCSRDAHKGVQSRRSDLESLAYNMVYWLTGSLPWIDDLQNPEMVQRKKRHCFIDTSGFLYFCMTDPPRILKEFFQYINSLDVEDSPDYNGCQQFINKALREHGYHAHDPFDFNNCEGWGLAKKKFNKELNLLLPPDEFKRPPLLSNQPMKPILRKKTNKKQKKAAALNWSRMLSDPEVLLKKVRVRNYADTSESTPPAAITYLDLAGTNPTPAMREVYQRFEERRGFSPLGYGEWESMTGAPEGYTPAMVIVWQRMIEQQVIEEAVKCKERKCRRSKRTMMTSATTTKRGNNNHNVCSIESSKSRSKSTLPFTRTYSLRG